MVCFILLGLYDLRCMIYRVFLWNENILILEF